MAKKLKVVDNGMYWRQLGIFDPNKYEGQPIDIVGAGAIGSMTALILAKMGLTNIKIWDDDKVETHNLPNQMYPIVTVGMKKVTALNNLIMLFTDKNIKRIKQKWEKDAFRDNAIVIICTDNMKSRKAVWKAVKLKPNVNMFIDARMGGELMRIYTVDPMSINQGDKYEDTLYTDKQAENLDCTRQAIIYNLAGVAGFIANQIKKKLNGDELLTEEFFNEIIFDYKCMMMEKRRWS